MKYMVKGIVWIVLITIGLLLGPPLLIGFVWWKVLIFGIWEGIFLNAILH